jgi:hypothetical protein
MSAEHIARAPGGHKSVAGDHYQLHYFFGNRIEETSVGHQPLKQSGNFAPTTE